MAEKIESVKIDSLDQQDEKVSEGERSTQTPDRGHVEASNDTVIKEVHIQTTDSEEDEPKEDEEEVPPGKDKSRSERLKKFRELHMRRNEARKLNHQEVVEEDRRSKLPSNYEAQQKRLEWELADAKARQEAKEKGEDYERLKMLEVSADDLERMDRKRKKKNPDPGFTDFQQVQYRQYQRLTKQFKPELSEYEKQKEELGDSVYAGVNTILVGQINKPSEGAIDRMVEDLDKQEAKRAKFSRRREFRADADVDYINERNRKFNIKAGRFYDKYTSEIKQNLERGTAI